MPPLTLLIYVAFGVAVGFLTYFCLPWGKAGAVRRAVRWMAIGTGFLVYVVSPLYSQFALQAARRAPDTGNSDADLLWSLTGFVSYVGFAVLPFVLVAFLVWLFGRPHQARSANPS